MQVEDNGEGINPEELFFPAHMLKTQDIWKQSQGPRTWS